MLRHDVLPYSGPDGFVSVAATAVEDALSAGALPVVLADSDRLARLRSSLGSRAATMVAIDRSVTGRNPARVIPTLQKVLDHHDAEVRVVGEPLRAEDSAAVRDEVSLYELMLQLPSFQTWNCHLSCVYDTTVGDDLADAVTACHREHGDPSDAVDRARSTPLPPRPMASEELGVDRTTLSALRGFVDARAAKAGLDGERVDDLVYAVNEIVTNSICHGEGRARVSFWTERGAVACEVRDRGWIRDPLAGRVAPDPDRVNGRGLWLVNQLCDFVQVRSSPAGTTVRLHVDA